MNDAFRPRLLSASLKTATAVMPVTIVTGARQTGKSTLVRELQHGPERLYLTLDDLDTLEQARTSPEELIERGRRVTLDEVQRAPKVLLAVKKAVDEARQKGRFLLTGSANLLLLKTVSDTLAGRAAYLTLWPMTRLEQLGKGRAGLWSELLSAPDSEWDEVVRTAGFPEEDWQAFAARGGYPTPAIDLGSAEERQLWFNGYVKTYLERDVQEVSSVTALPDLRRLMRAACLRLGQLMNQTELGRDVSLPQPTVHRYLNLLEMSYQLVRLAPYSVNRTRRLIKTPKLYWADTAVAMHLGGATAAAGPHLENLVLSDLLAWRETRRDLTEILYWRTASGAEVDFVIETAKRVYPIEVKATKNPGTADARGLAVFRDEYGKTCGPGLLLHCGKRIEWLARGILAAPWWTVL